MNNVVDNGFKEQSFAINFVLDEHTPEHVARAMIESGKQKEPFYIFNMDEAHRRVLHFKELMPRIKIFYAIKSNDIEMMLKFAISQGLGFSCASPGEIYKLRQLNVNPMSIIYAMPSKSPEYMVYARKAGVKHTTFDSSFELQKLKEYWPDARLLIRIRVDSDCQTSLGDKFGCDFETEAFNLLEEAADLGLNVVGVAFRVVTECKLLYSYVTALKHARALFDHETDAGRGMKVVDIGGGFLSDRIDRIDHFSKLVNTALEDFFPDPEVQVIAEPGRYICDSAFTLYSNINNVRRVVKNGKTVNMIYINDGVYGTMRYPEKWHAVSKFKSPSEKDMGNLEDTILWGPSCAYLDQVMRNRSVQLPRCMPCDWMIVENHGAYTISFSTRFSTIEIPLVRSVVSLDLWRSIKDNAVFRSSDFVILQEISTPLPMTLPSLPHIDTTHEHSHIPTLKV
ncbi:hypothetical protein K1T71_005232 [Dendrolimus kikuchii]|uniref:Uncharacterized protein n=1 Tax=Dendrolimus kikuchii TaxID=765133 RepID=A0ACC1D6N8_9NEOP|nr:hypothetical protein K1T71_005232 [Dendrolimus kikuchii]